MFVARLVLARPEATRAAVFVSILFVARILVLAATRPGAGRTVRLEVPILIARTVSAATRIFMLFLKSLIHDYLSGV